MQYSSNSLSDIVEQYVKDRILSGRCKSGDKLTEADISGELGISRAPVREALRTLNVQGLLFYSPRRAHYIWEMERAEILETFQIRIDLELQVLRILVNGGLVGEKELAHLQQLADQMAVQDAAAEDIFARTHSLNSLDLSFHQYLWQLSGSKKRAVLLENLFFQLLIVMNENIATLGSGPEKAQEHWRMIDALKTKDEQRVCLELKTHLNKYIVAALGELTEQEAQTLDALFGG